MEAASSVVIEPIDVRSLSDGEIADINDYQNAMRAESNPEDPPKPLDQLIGFLRSIPAFVDVWAWLGRSASGAVVCGAQAVSLNTGDNPHVLQVNIAVLPEHRRAGLGRDLLSRVAQVAGEKGKLLLIGGTNERVPAGVEFCQRVGAQPGLKGHTNRLVLDDVNIQLVKRWIVDGPARAPGYELIGFDGRCPDDLVEEVVDILGVMNDQPRDDLQMEDRLFNVEQFRETERLTEAQGGEQWRLFARHVETRRLVGLTDVIWNPNRPETVFQGNTGVRPEHRGRALGKWLKAQMLDRILAERAHAKDIRTGNADSNAAMLAINRQLGFRPYIASTTWQVELDAVNEYLARVTKERG